MSFDSYCGGPVLDIPLNIMLYPRYFSVLLSQQVLAATCTAVEIPVLHAEGPQFSRSISPFQGQARGV